MDPVLVLGAGPVGQTTALLLARWGVPSIVLDQRTSRDAVGSKAICQQRDVLDIWDSVGAHVADEGVTWGVARTFYRDRELFARTFGDPGRSPFPPFVNISQTRTEQILDERIASSPLIDLRWGHEVVSILQYSNGVEVQVAGGERLRGSHLVVCTGARSDSLRSLLGVDFEGRSFDDRFLICDIRADLPWAAERRFYFDPLWNPGRQVLIHPCPDSTYRIDWQVPPGYEADDVDTRIRQIIGSSPYELVWQSVYRFHSRVASRLRVGRVLLAGDAAHLVAPFGARGLNSGVADAENAAWKIAAVRLGAPDSLLESYHVERRAAALENIAVTSATMDFLVPATPEAVRLREKALESGNPALIDSGRLAEPFWYTGSPLTWPDWRNVPAVPGPGALVPDVSVAGTRLRGRHGFRVLAGPLTSVPGTRLDGEAAEVLGARPDEVWVLRPDGYVASVLRDPVPGQVAWALARAGRPPGGLVPV